LTRGRRGRKKSVQMMLERGRRSKKRKMPEKDVYIGPNDA